MSNEERINYQHYTPPHSDFLVYWTGKDIEAGLAPGSGAESLASTTDTATTDQYTKRLKSILKYGLWMNDPDDEGEFCIAGHLGYRPVAPRVCFTELKLSEARAHAARYGRLGIGFKRPFVVERGGLPVLYYPHWAGQWLRSIGRQTLTFGPKDIYACFLKRMGSGTRISYDYLNESEWRIVLAPWLEEKGYVTRPQNSKEFLDEHPATRETDSQCPRYLLPVNSRWLALIIYPSIQAKHAAQEDPEVRQLLRAIKPSGHPGPVPPSETAPWEKFILPIEIELDDCRNF